MVIKMNIKANENNLLSKGIDEVDDLCIIAPSIIGEKIALKLYNEWLNETPIAKGNTILFEDALYYIHEELLDDIKGVILEGIKDNLKEKDLYLY